MEENKNTTDTPVEQPKVDNEVEKIKVKKKPKKKKFQEPSDGVTKVDLKDLVEKAEDIVKVDLNKPVEEIKAPEQPVEEKTEETKVETPVVEEITEEEVKVKEAPAPIKVETPKAPEQPKLPENVEKLVNFMKDTGGDINDYVKLNIDYSDMDNLTLLKEYYKTTKPHLQTDEIDFMMEDQFSYDAEVDDEREVKRKKLALKEQVANAKTELEQFKSKYYDEIKAGSRLTPEAKKAMDFFNRYNEESEKTQQIKEEATSVFLNKTNNVFNDEFKGFEYKVGDKRFRFNVNNADKVKETQSSLDNFIGKFLNEKGQIEDASGYHKALYTAMNSDAIAKHFYEQGKADAMKDSVAKAKNINMDPRQQHSGDTIGGIKVRALGEGSSDFKFKIKRKK